MTVPVRNAVLPASGGGFIYILSARGKSSFPGKSFQGDGVTGRQLCAFGEVHVLLRG